MLALRRVPVGTARVAYGAAMTGEAMDALRADFALMGRTGSLWERLQAGVIFYSYLMSPGYIPRFCENAALQELREAQA